jgi:Bacterial protein of unknown function (Gcw_chp)
MSRAKVLGTALVLVAAIATAGPAAAQVTVGADVGLFTDYVWRGITYTNQFVIEPDAYVTIPAGNASITVGGWANIEPGQYDGAGDISEGGGLSSFDLTEFDWWGELSYPVGIATLTGGVTGYIYPNDAGLTSDANTVEIYGKAAFDVLLSPKLAVWYDVDKINGAYFEGSISHSLPLVPAAPLVLGAVAGLSAGQGIPDSGNDSFNFVDDGFTHLDLSVAMPFSAGPLSISPAVHAIITGDEATKYDGFDDSGALNNKDVKFWFGATISWSKAFGEEEAPAEAEPAAE